MLHLKKSLSDYTEAEFVALLQRIINHNGTESEVDELVFHYEEVSEHPAVPI